MMKSSQFRSVRAVRGLLPCLVAAILLTAPIQAQDALQLSTDLDREIEASGLDAMGGKIHLTVDQAVAIALERNLGLLVERYEHSQFQLQIDEALGIYDLNLRAQVVRSEETSPSATELEGAAVLTDKNGTYGFDLNQLTPIGGTGTVQFGTFNRDSNADNTLLDPYFSTDLDVSYSQPLLRDFGRDVTDRGIRIARINSDLSRERFEQEVITTIQQVINAYFNLTEAREQVAVAEESRSLAVELHDMNKVRVEVGTLPPLDLISSEVGIATREEEIIRAEQAVGDAEDDLRTLLNLEEGVLWDTEIVPDASADPERQTLDLEASISSALEMRPEIRQMRLDMDRLGIEADYWDNQALPSLTAVATYGYNGLGGDVLQRAPDGTVISVMPGGFGDSLDQIWDREFDGWRFEVNFGYPIQNRAAKARRARADLDVEQAQLELSELSQSIRTEVRKAVRAVHSAEQQIDSARASSRLAEKNLDAERKRYENGLSTSFQVLEIQEDLSQARSREVSAIATYRRALTDYHRATGTILESSGVEWNEGEDVE